MKIQQDFQIKETQSHLYPRCEYRTRIYDTSIFEMSNPKFWGTYFRSKSGRIPLERIEIGNENFLGDITNKNFPWKTGGFRNPFEIYRKKHVEETWPKETVGQTSHEMKKSAKEDTYFLYDDLLEYKCNICKLVVKQFQGKLMGKIGNINVYYKNDYPCVMVQVKAFHEKEDEIKKDEINWRKYSYRIVQAYFVAITCYEAINIGIPTELVNRASFGHNIPSVAETGTSLRINIGITPQIYAKEVLVESLLILNNLLPSLLKKKIFYSDSDSDSLSLIAINKNIDVYNTKKPEKFSTRKKLESDDTVLVLLREREVAFQIAIQRNNIDYLTDEIILQMPEKSEEDFSIPLKTILVKLYEKKAIDFENTSERNDIEKKNESIKNDNLFWEIIRKVASSLERTNSSGLSNTLTNKELSGLYSTLEKANWDFIKSCNVQSSEQDGYGSDSDSEYEVRSKSTIIHSKKIIVSTGMRAIYMAHRGALHIIGTKKTHIDTKYMYYETADAVRNLSDQVNKKLNLEHENRSQKIIYIDLNHCSCSGPDTTDIDVHIKNIREEIKRKCFNKKIESQKAIVFDYTSATTIKIRKVIREITPYVDVLFLVNSGLKNEQIGADVNTYGTVRIYSTNKKHVENLYYAIKRDLGRKDELAHESHAIRRQYRDVGAVITTEYITEENAWKKVPKRR